MSLLASLSTRGKLTLAACALGFLVTAVVLVRMASAPSYTTILAGVDAAQTQKVSTALTAAGIGFELQNGGTAIGVEKAKADQARVALAEKGLNGGSVQPGYELLDKAKLGSSNFQQQIAYQRALEGQIAQTIGQIDGVGGAQVRLTLPKDDLFADEKRGATAAVLLGGEATNLDPGSVRGVANLVASSVPGLKAQDVTITDAAGQMLWPAGDGAGGDGAGGATASKPAAEAKYNAQLTSALDAMLARTLGAGKAQVQVRSDLDVDQATEEELTYARRGTPLEEETETETLKGGGSSGGRSGARGNVPQYAAAAAGANSDYQREKTTRRNGVNKTVTRRQKAPGTVNKLSVSVMVDKNLKPAPDMAALTRSIEAAAGVDRARGDVVQVTAIPFAKVDAPKAAGSPIPAGAGGALKMVGIGGAALAFLFFVTRHLRRRESEALLDEPSWLRQLEAARPAGGRDPILDLPPAQPTMQMPAIVPAEDPRRAQLDEIITREPERVAAHLRSWITEDAK